MIKGIVGVGPKLEIGYKNSLPWNCPRDLQYFKQCTLGCAVLMGRNTWESLNGRFLKGRTNYIISPSLRQYLDSLDKKDVPEIYKEPLVKVIDSIDDLVLKYSKGNEDLWVIGGLQVYKTMSEYIKEFHVSEINTFGKKIKADVHFDKNILSHLLLDHVVNHNDFMVNVYKKKKISVLHN